VEEPRGSGPAAMVLESSVLGSVWLAGLTAVHRVQPQSLPRNRDAGRVAVKAAQPRPQTAPVATARRILR
jgi:hypothetical protein